MQLKKLVFIVGLLVVGFLTNAQQLPFYADIQAFNKQDSVQAPPQHPILLIGSSSFTRWQDVQSYFPGYVIVNRGFGGSTLLDLIRYADNIIFPYQPKQILIYCGENDLSSSNAVTAEMVVDRFKTLFGMIRVKLPNTPVAFVSLKPSPSRQQLMAKMEVVNKDVKKYLKDKPHTAFIDVYHPMLTKENLPITTLFVEDNLHMNAQGYAIWKKVIEPYLLK
ncbi:GDSL-type esterase/lipase family protein [Flavisolibacter tropicus]|uniref:G-D-S-L family lipolytic protein n=1 Tax=Flavisolibacter tropicus TaxID=1492898 RepID=A0A172TW63_9BACT|nr:GDSL-type esterase/lipase family protein [Flavisolibacter tropicus]ANE51043.1 G-D-S-L family lipolytic protein [Flavisolibacter tropicus]